MNVIKIFHYLSHARWIFFLWSLLLMVQAFLNPGHYALANTGLAVFLMGLFLGFLGFGDIERLSRREKKEFADQKNMKVYSAVLLGAAGFSFIMGLFFMNIHWLRPGLKESIEIELKTVGYHCFAFGFGFLCYLKMLFDKYKYYLSLPEDQRAPGSSLK
jgi:hypothetical protein